MRLMWYMFRWTAAGALFGAAIGYVAFRLLDFAGTHYVTAGVLFAIPGALTFLLVGFFVGVFLDNRTGM